VKCELNSCIPQLWKLLVLDGSSARGGVSIHIIWNGTSVPWTFGTYMYMKMRHIGPDAVQLGVSPSSEVCHSL
jgi:hypothetical protein